MVIGFERLKGLVLSPMGLDRISVVVVALGLVEWALSTSFAIVEDRQQGKRQREAQGSSSTNYVGFHVGNKLRLWGPTFSNLGFEKSNIIVVVCY